MTNTYTLRSVRLDGSIELTYTDGLLTIVKIDVKQPLNEIQFRALVSNVPYDEAALPALKSLNLTVTLNLTTNMKIDLFCRVYMEEKGIKYQVSAADSGKIKLVKIDEPLVRFYMKSTDFMFKNKHSIGNLVKYFNELRALFVAPPEKPKGKHPDYYSEKYMKTLDGKGTSEYTQHLHSLGLKPKRNRFQEIVDWVKEDLIT